MSSRDLAIASAIVLALSLALSTVAVSLGTRFRYVAGKRSIPALGGVAVLFAWWGGVLLQRDLRSLSSLGSLALASAVILWVGIRDVRRPLSPGPQLFTQLAVAGVTVLLGGIAIRYVTNPLGGLLRLDQWDVSGYALPGTFLTVVWIVTLMNVMNFLDGMDGLASSVGAVAFATVGFVSLLPQVADRSTGFLALLAAAALGGFLFWNLPPAALYLGTVGSWFVGYLLAVLAAQGVSKVATVAVVGAVPLLDAVTVVLGRLRRGQSPFRGDRTHLHHRLERRGLSARTILLLYLLVSGVLGTSAVLLQTQFKLIVFASVSVLFVFLILVGSRVVRRQKAERTGRMIV